MAQDNARKAEATVASMGKQNFFDLISASSSRSEHKFKKGKEPSKDPNEMMESMHEIMKNLTLLTRDLAKSKEAKRYRQPYVPKPYWNQQKKPNEGDRRNHVSQTSPEPPIINWSEEQNMEDPKYPTHGDDTPYSPKNVNWVDNFRF